MGNWGKYLKQYSVSWEKDPKIKNWIEPSSESDVLQGKPEAFCKLCKVHLRAHKNDLLKHAERPKHIAREKSLNRTEQPSLHNYAYVQVIEESKIIDLRLAVFVALHSSLQSIDHLGDLLKVIEKGSSLEKIRLHRTKCSKLISGVIAPAFLTELIVDIGESPYAIIADEATDASVDNMCCTAFQPTVLSRRVTFGFNASYENPRAISVNRLIFPVVILTTSIYKSLFTSGVLLTVREPSNESSSCELSPFGFGRRTSIFSIKVRLLYVRERTHLRG